MKARIPAEWEKKIDDYIYIDLLIGVLEKKQIKAEKEGNLKFAEYINNMIRQQMMKRRELSDFLKEKGIKIDPPKSIDDMFVQYYFSVKVDGGYKEGTMRYWKAAMKYKLKKMINEVWR